MSSKKFYSDTAWSLGSFAAQAASGAVLNFALMSISGPAYLGLFNQFYAAFVIVGQFAVFGLHDSLQKHVSELMSDVKAVGNAAKSALVLALMSATTAAAILFFVGFALKTIGRYELGLGLMYLAPALVFFVLNKVLLSLLNGLLRMRAYAFIQGLRAIALVFLCVGIAFLKMNASYLGLCFFFTEVLLIIALYCLTKNELSFSDSIKDNSIKEWKVRHKAFGLLALPQGLLTETMVRIDVLMLSLFFSEDRIGVYSFVAFFIEGLLQIPLLIRTVTNPRLTPLLISKNKTMLINESKRSIVTSGLITCLACMGLWLLFPWLLHYFPKTDMPTSIALLSILLPGLALYSFFAPIEQLLMQGGRPGLQSVGMLIVASVNIVLNAILIPTQGLNGAALATSIAYAMSGFVFLTMAYTALGLSNNPKGNR